jgi:hypothetical protein
MSEFQQQLDDEIEKRESEADKSGTEKNSPSKAPKSEKTGSKNFSGSSFLKGLAVCFLFLLALVGWALFKADDTKAGLQSKLASKTAVVTQADSSVIRMGDAQPVLRMQPVKNKQPEPAEQQPRPPVESEQDDALLSQYDGKAGLVPAPVPGLYENIPEGLAPKPRAEDGLTPFEAYKRPFDKNTQKPIVSFVVTDLGISRSVTEDVIDKFPPEISLSFSPYARDLKLLTDVARKAGHEVWLMLPLETRNYPLNDPGPSTLLVNASVEQNQRRLSSVLTSTQGYAGFVSEKDHVFRQEDADVNPNIKEIFDRGLAVLDSNTSVSSFVGGYAAQKDYPHTKNQFWLDEDLTPIAMNQQLRKMMEYAKGNGSVVMMLRPYPASLKAVQKFLQSDAAKEFQIAPVSAQVRYGE